MKKVKNVLKYISIAFLLYVFFCLATPFNHYLKNRSIDNQIQYLSSVLDSGYDDKLQSRFPEGKMFSNSLLALSVIEFCEKNNLVNKEYSIVVDNCINRMQSKRALGAFNSGMVPKYGMFYNAWSNYVYKSYLESQLFSLSTIQKSVLEESAIIEDRLREIQMDSLRILDSYPNSSWPADNLIGIMSLEKSEWRQSWLVLILQTSSHQSELVNHVSSNTARIRGSSSAMITYCLNKIDYAEIKNYNQQFNKFFIDEYLGVQLVKENENGSDKMDIDSGPVVCGYGASATIVNIKTQASMGINNAQYTWAAMNTIALPINLFGRKYYLFKKEPMLDLFMLWSCVEL